MDRLTPQDLITLWPEDLGWPQDIAALAVLEPGDLLDDDGVFQLDAARTVVERRLHRAPRLRQVLMEPPWGLGRPLWVDAPAFDLDQHVRVRPIPEPGDESQLLSAAEELMRSPLDRSRPLWQMWFLPGLTGGRIGLYLRVHHVVADGPAAVVLLGALLDLGPTDTASPGAPRDHWTPTPAPTSSELFEDNLRFRLGNLQRAGRALRHPTVVGHRVQRVWRGVREIISEGFAPRSSLNQQVGPERRLTVHRGRLELVRQVAHAQGATVNDVLLTAVAAGLREMLIRRGDPTEGVVLRAFVPVSLRPAEDTRGGNVLGMIIGPLPVGVEDPVGRLRMIAEQTAARKASGHAQTGAAARSGVLPRFSVRIMARQRIANTQVSNVAGPTTPLSFAGAEIREIFPVVPLIGNITLIVGALSYAGQFTIATLCDPAACPDIDAFDRGVGDTLARLRASVPRPAEQASRSADPP